LSVQCSAAVRLRRALLVATAISFASIDLLHKLFDHAEFHHARSPLTAVAMAALVTALIVLVPRISSNAAAIEAGVACGGALGNLVSLLAWSQGVPDPLVLAGETQGLAFNLADLFALSGDVLLLSAAVVHGIRHRERLRERV
jgi:lipoprotein signal peptidase